LDFFYFLQILLGYGADVNAQRTDTGATALFLACEDGFVDVARLLIEAGAE
jgi:ankyrin repeat protein